MLPLLLSSALLAAAPPDGVQVRQVLHHEVVYTVVGLDLRHVEIALLGQDPEHPELRTFAAVEAWLAPQGKALLVATNAGMFERDHTPVGLHVERGVEHNPILLGEGSGNFFLLPNGVFYIDEQGAHVVDSTRYVALAESVVLATQSGPLLLQDGVVHPAFQEQSPNQLPRSGVGVDEAGIVWLAIAFDGVRFHDMATLFRDELGCRDALFLDGIVSTMWAPGLEREGQGSGRYSGVLTVTAR
jgi:uncharacterized protein YigE (DUF2233 family)